MELRQLATFREVAAAGGFTKAAERLGYAQSSVTTQIQALERELGVRLFERLGKRVVLTESGRLLLGYAERILKLADEARAAIAQGDEPTGTLIIGAAETLCTYRLPPVLRRYRARFPRVQLILKPGLCPDMRRAVREGQLDLAFLLEEPVCPPDLVVEPLVREEVRVLVHPDHPLAKREAVGPHDLDGETLLVTEGRGGYRARFERALVAAGVRPSVVLEFGGVEAIKQCAIAGMGVAVLPAVAVAEEVSGGQLVALPWCGPDLSVVTQLAWHKDKWLSPTLRAFLQVTREMLCGGEPPSRTNKAG